VDKVEKAGQLLERAAALGLVVEFRDGVNVLKEKAPVGPEVINFMLQELAKYLPEVRAICQRRSVAALAKKYIGSRIFSKEHGAGTLVGASEDGTLTISISSEMRRSDEEESRSSQMSITSHPEGVLILDDSQATSAASPNEPTKAEQPKRGLLDRLGLGSRED
jgi:hypothetical protein